MSFFFEDISDRRRQEEQLTSDRDYLRRELGGLDAGSEIVGSSSGLRHMKERVAMVAGTNTTVLITGETGTGKELVARAIHEASPRRERLLVKVNCAAISAGLVESELFGHEKGAFTGAVAAAQGALRAGARRNAVPRRDRRAAAGDAGQAAARAAGARVRARGRQRDRSASTCGVIAATNRNLPQMVARGQFREDLYYRLNVFPMALPPLRERAEDIPLLVHSFLRRFARQAGKRIDDVAPEAMWRLLATTGRATSASCRT